MPGHELHKDKNYAQQFMTFSKISVEAFLTRDKSYKDIERLTIQLKFNEQLLVK